MPRIADIPQTDAGQTIAELIRHYRIRPNHLRGQNFLVDDEVYEDIVAAAQLSSNDTVLEVGGGLGTLTSTLAEHVARVVVMEIDTALVAILRHRFAEQATIVVAEADVRTTRVDDLELPSIYKVVANIPYYLSGAFFKKFLTQDRQPQSITVLVQKEVAERITAQTGNMSLLALSVQLYGTPHLVRVVPADSFYPAPKVESAILHIDDIRPFPFAIEEKFFWRVARIGFAARRKQLRNTLAAGFSALSKSQLDEVFRVADLKATVRAEALTLDDWRRLSEALLAVSKEH